MVIEIIYILVFNHLICGVTHYPFSFNIAATKCQIDYLQIFFGLIIYLKVLIRSVELISVTSKQKLGI